MVPLRIWQLGRGIDTRDRAVASTLDRGAGCIQGPAAERRLVLKAACLLAPEEVFPLDRGAVFQLDPGAACLLVPEEVFPLDRGAGFQPDPEEVFPLDRGAACTLDLARTHTEATSRRPVFYWSVWPEWVGMILFAFSHSMCR
jgi:hypothetical protein